ncbi:MAG: hypothetical protein NVSMB44_04460 [Ktedonobacteraceae bacterium]
MNKDMQNDINAILDSMYPQDHEDINTHDQELPRRVINVYIEVEEPEQPATIESTLHTQTNATEPEITEPQQSKPVPVQPTRHPYTKPKSRLPLLLLLVSFVGLLIEITSGLILPLLTPSATVTIVTTAVEQTSTTTIHIVNGAADPTKQQLAGRVLSFVTMSQQKTIPTTGTAHQDAKAGHGIITFYNAATYPQTILAGTILTGTDSMQLVTDTDATIPAAIFPTFGQASIPAHVPTTGPGGNIRAGDVYGACCRLNISAVNGAFTGGQDERSYQIVTPQDINSVATSLKTGVERSVQAALQTQIQPTETLITPLPCTQKVTPDHQPGEEATHVTVTIDETCTGTVYTTQAFTSMTAQIAAQDAEKRLGTGYRTTGLQSSITQATPKEHGSIDLQVKSVSLWAYQFNEAQQQVMRAMIAGMSKEKAQGTILHMNGVQSTSITIKNNGSQLPTDSNNIHLNFIVMG